MSMGKTITPDELGSRNRFTMHRHFEDVEDVELEMSRIAAKAEELVELLSGSRLPKCVLFGLAGIPLREMDRQCNEELASGRAVSLSTMLGIMAGGDVDGDEE